MIEMNTESVMFFFLAFSMLLHCAHTKYSLLNATAL